MASTDTPADQTEAPTPRSAGARATMAAASVVLVMGLILYAAAAARLVWPGWADRVALLSYGRLLPTATALLLGWLLLAAVAAAWHVVPRSGGSRIAGRTMGAGALLVAAGILASSAAVAAGLGEGGRLLEGPWWADVVLAGGLLLAASAATRSGRSGGDRVGLPAWYLLAALWWALASVVVGVVPGIEGVPAALQARFAAAVVGGLVPAAAGLGAAYHLVARLVPDAAFHPRLGRIGFWSIGFAWLGLAPAGLQYGPVPAWLGTIPVLFAAGLVVGVLAVLADLAHALHGKWTEVGTSPPLRLTVAGVALFGLLPLQILVQALRGPSTVTHFTSWETALEILLLIGPATLWLLGLAALVVPAGRPLPLRTAAAHRLAVLAGLGTALFSLWIAGLVQGYAWVGSVNSGIANWGDTFRNSVEPLEGLRTAAAVGLGVVALGSLVFLVALLAGARRGEPLGDWAEGEPAPGKASVGRATAVSLGALVLFLSAGLLVFVLPAVDVGSEPSALAAATRPADPESAAARGRDVYIREGCWLCHTQQVRAVVTDVGLGPVSVPGDYVYDPADLLGVARIGPDLAHAASREGASDPAGHLSDPRGLRPWSIMPAYAHLSDADLEDLAAYLETLE